MVTDCVVANTPNPGVMVGGFGGTANAGPGINVMVMRQKIAAKNSFKETLKFRYGFGYARKYAVQARKTSGAISCLLILKRECADVELRGLNHLILESSTKRRLSSTITNTKGRRRSSRGSRCHNFRDVVIGASIHRRKIFFTNFHPVVSDGTLQVFRLPSVRLLRAIR